MKGLQYFSDDYLEQCKKMSTRDICEFLENYRLAHASPKTRQTNKRLLSAFKTKCKLHGLNYKEQIDKLMLDWLSLESKQF